MIGEILMKIVAEEEICFISFLSLKHQGLIMKILIKPETRNNKQETEKPETNQPFGLA